MNFNLVWFCAEVATVERRENLANCKMCFQSFAIAIFSPQRIVVAIWKEKKKKRNVVAIRKARRNVVAILRG